MIEKMKKLSFLVFYKDYGQFLIQLRELGVIHVQTCGKGTAEDPDLDAEMTLFGNCNSTIQALESLKIPRAESNDGNFNSAVEITEAYNALTSRKAAIEQKLAANLKDEADLAPWGGCDPAVLEAIRCSGHELHFYTCPPKAYREEWGGFEINRDKQKVYFVTVDTPPGSIKADECHIPERSPEVLKAETAALNSELEECSNRLVRLAAVGLPILEEAREDLKERIEFDKVRLSGEKTAENTLLVLQGWIPEKRLEEASSVLDKGGWFWKSEDPEPEDEIPIQLKNGRFAKLFEPLTRLYMLPDYHELDLTLFFAPFFMLFFGLCLGDMGYGLLMIVALPIFTKLFKLINPDFSKWLVVLFGISTILCGALSGSFFGFSIYDLNIPLVQKMKALLYLENSTMFTVSLCIGVVQILFGMILKAVNQSIQLGFKYALSTIGWIVLLLTVIVSVLAKIPFGNPVIIILLGLAAAGIFLFNSPGKNPLLNIGLGLWDTYNMATGLLGDVLSYVRLFALGLSGSILANVFNNMATGMSPEIPVVGFLITAIIFCLGHALNIFMNILGAVVHPMRLTFVEFFKNAGYTGGGVEYRPFKKNNKQIKQ